MILGTFDIWSLEQMIVYHVHLNISCVPSDHMIYERFNLRLYNIYKCRKGILRCHLWVWQFQLLEHMTLLIFVLIL